MEPLKHECGVAIVRLRKPLSYFKEKYGTYRYAINKLYLLMEKQHNRGQEAAGVGVIKLQAPPGSEYLFRERALGSGAIQEIFNKINHDIDSAGIDSMSPAEVEESAPFLGEIYMGHLRYSTTGKSGISYVHPFLRRNNWCSRNLMLCGNFNMTNVDTLFEKIVERGQHPRIYSDTIILLEQLGYALDRENHRVYRDFRGSMKDPQLTHAIERHIDMSRVLADTAPMWDGGFVICGATGSGDMFALRDRNGIRPAFYYIDDEIVVVTSERPPIQTVFNTPRSKVSELKPGDAIIVNADGEITIKNILPAGRNARCSFERIYFSRGSDADIYRERKALGRALVPELMKMLHYDLSHAVFSFIPNTAETAYLGLIEGLEAHMDADKEHRIMNLQQAGKLTPSTLHDIMAEKLRVEKIAIKDIKLRTFIAEGASRNELAAHVYDVTYGCIQNDTDTLVVIDDSIVRGTTLRQSILTMLDRLHPRRIIVLSSSPQVRYPDYYGIDMSRMNEFIAFRAAVELLKLQGKTHILEQVYRRCLEMENAPDNELENCVKAIYEPFTVDDISLQIARMLTPPDIKARVDILYPGLEILHKAIPDAPGDWYFSGDYPTPGGIRRVNRAYVNYYENKPLER